MNRTLLVAFAAGIALMSTGCAANQVPLRTAIGKSTSSVTGQIRNGSFAVQDASAAVGLKPVNDGSGQDWSGWLVVAICANDTDLVAATKVDVAVIPSKKMTAAVRAKAEKGSFDNYLDCSEGRDHHG